MSKKLNSNKFICTNCLTTFNQWSGRCLNCQEWNTIEVNQTIEDHKNNSKFIFGQELQGHDLKPVKARNSQLRLDVGINEVNQFLGGGLVKGSVNLISGQPGIGKSTFLIQLAANLAHHQKVLYISAEESDDQVRDRAQRLQLTSQNLSIINCYLTDDILATIASQKYDVLIIDSIQTISCSWVNSAVGSIAQITNSTQSLTQMAKEYDVTLLIIGHVTKDGSIAGPKLLEHIVDVVIQLEGDRYGGFKILKSQKNRFGSTAEVLIFELNETGFKIIDNPSKILLEERLALSGSVVTSILEGNRAILIEVQALVNPSNFGYPKRTASGFDLNRLNLLIAVLEQRTNCRLGDQDVFINVVGGLSIDEPANDLAICLAIISAYKKTKVKDSLITFGEVGLAGEIRHVNHIDKRINEAIKQGFNLIIGPKSEPSDYYQSVSHLNQAIKLAF